MTINWIERADKQTFEVFNFLDGKRSNVGGEQQLEKFSPRDGKLIYRFGEGTVADANAAVASAKAAFDDGRWRTKSVHERKAVLCKLADLLEANQEELGLYDSMDVGKPITNALGDIGTSAGILRDAAACADMLAGQSAMDGGTHSYQLHKPLGVIGAIVGWNFPLVLAAHKVGAALVTGNSLILKASEFTPLSACRFAELAAEAGVPEGVFNVVNGRGTIIGDTIARHNDVQMIAFTGSSATGKQLMVSAGQSNMKRLQLECGGKSPYIIFDDYRRDLEKLADDVCDMAYPNQGALCSSSTRLLMQEGIQKKLQPLLLERIKALNPSDPLLPECTFGAIMNEAHMHKVLGYHDSAIESGAELLFGGGRIMQETGGFYLKPALFFNVNSDSRVAKEEIFGPMVSLFSFKTEAEAIALANDTDFGLAAYIASSDHGRMHRMARDIESGCIILASSMDIKPGGVSFGLEPTKQSGLGYEGGVAGLKAYTQSSGVFSMFEG